MVNIPVAGGNNKCFLLRDGLDSDWHSDLTTPIQETQDSKCNQDV